DVRIAGDDDDIAGIPAELLHLVARHGQERRDAEARGPVLAIAGEVSGNGGHDSSKQEWGWSRRAPEGARQGHIYMCRPEGDSRRYLRRPTPFLIDQGSPGLAFRLLPGAGCAAV